MPLQPLQQPSASDSIAAYTPPPQVSVASLRKGICVEEDAPASQAEWLECHHGVIEYAQGFELVDRPELPGYNTLLMSIIVALFLILCLGAGSYSNFFKSFSQNLFKSRRRGNAFDETTVSESRITVGFLLLACVCEGIVSYSALPAGLNFGFTAGLSIALLSAVAIALMVFQGVGYLVTGYTFADFTATRLWLKGFFASQSLLGMLMVIPAIIVIFNPKLSPAIILISIGLYLLCRIIFVSKGFRIFYTNIFSLVYFILYLCTLEITPLLILLRFARNLGE